MKITVKKLSELHKPAHNIRRHSEKQLTEYIRSIISIHALREEGDSKNRDKISIFL